MIRMGDLKDNYDYVSYLARSWSSGTHIPFSFRLLRSHSMSNRYTCIGWSWRIDLASKEKKCCPGILYGI